jgi:hypothetical protein
MGILKTTIRVESKDLFPAPVDFAKLSLNKAQGKFSTFAQASCDPITPLTLNLGPVNNGTSLIYAEAPSTNDAPIYLSEAIGGNVFVVLYPGQVSMFPYGQNALGGADIQALSAGPGVNVLNYFVADNINTTTYNISINSFIVNDYVDDYLG